MQSHSVKVIVKSAQYKNGTSKKTGNAYNMTSIKGLAAADSPFKTDLDVECSVFLRDGDKPSLPSVGDTIQVDIDNLQISKRAISVTGQIIR